MTWNSYFGQDIYLIVTLTCSGTYVHYFSGTFSCGVAVITDRTIFVLGNEILPFALLSNLQLLLPFTCSEIQGSYWRDMCKGESFQQWVRWQLLVFGQVHVHLVLMTTICKVSTKHLSLQDIIIDDVYAEISLNVYTTPFRYRYALEIVQLCYNYIIMKTIKFLHKMFPIS